MLKLVRRKTTPIWYVSGSLRGQRYFESTRTASRAHAEAYRQEREREILDGTFFGRARTAIFADAVALYLEKGGEKRFVPPLLDRWGSTKLVAITAEEVSRFAREHYAGREPATVRRQLYVPLNAIMRQAHRGRLVPLVSFEAPKVKKKPVRYGDDAWFRAFFAVASYKLAAVVMFLTTTGARVSEVCRLADTDLALDRGECVLRDTKTGRPRRIPLAPQIVDIIRRCLSSVAREIDGEVRVFGYKDRGQINRAIARACRRAGIAYLSSHKVGRHSAAARLLARGESLKTVQEALGWSSIRMPADNYGHLEQQATDRALRDAAAGLPALPAPEKK